MWYNVYFTIDSITGGEGNLVTYHLIRIAVISLFIGLWPVGPANAVDECCTIVVIDRATRIVTVINRNSGRTFDFTVNNEALLTALRPEMNIGLIAEPGSSTLSVTGVIGMNKIDWGRLVDGIDECCSIVWTEQLGLTSSAIGATPLEKSMIGPRRPLIESGIVTGIDLAPGVRLEITELKRIGPNLVTMTYIVTNGTDARINMASWGIAEYGSRGGSFNGIKLLDYQNGNVHPVIYDAGNNCRCSYGGPNIEAGASKSFWAEFATPPGDVDKIGISFKNAPPIYGVPLSNQ